MLGSPQTAYAGPVEELTQLAVHPGDPDKLVLRFEFSGDGLLYSNDGGKTFSFMCGSAVSDPESDAGSLQKLGPIGIAGNGQVLLGTFGGLWHDDGHGCAWSRESTLVDRWVTDIVAHPSDPEVSFLITSNGGEAENGVVRRNADGTYTELGNKSAILINRLRVVELPEGGLRFYQSAVLGQLPVAGDDGSMTTKPNYAIRVSDDEGETWTEHGLGVLDGTMRLEAIDPGDPNRIVISVSRDKDAVTGEPLADSVLVSSNQGESFEEWTTVTTFGGIAFAPEGRVWVGDAGTTTSPDAPRGIQYAESLAEEPTVLTGDYPVRCLHHTGDRLFVCQRFAFGRASVEDGSFTPAVELSKLQSMNECEGVDTASVCRQQLCTGYCGLGHFATAPFCKAAYDSNEERGCAPLPVPDAGTVGGAGGTSAIPVDSGVAGTMSDEDGSAKLKKTGCDCHALGSAQSAHGGYALLGALGLLLPLLRRRCRA